MKQHAMIVAALGSLLTLSAVSVPVQVANAAGKEKCYDVARAGQNDCVNPGSAHTYVSQSRINRGPMSWKYVSAGTCAQVGSTMRPASK